MATQEQLTKLNQLVAEHKEYSLREGQRFADLSTDGQPVTLEQISEADLMDEWLAYFEETQRLARQIIDAEAKIKQTDGLTLQERKQAGSEHNA